MSIQLPSLSSLFSGEGIGSMILCLWIIVCRRMMFKKAGLPGWGAIIPFYNIYLRFKLCGMSGWWVLSLLFAPLFLIVLIVSLFKAAEKFGKSVLFGFGLLIFNPIFIGILAFDKSKYSA